MSKLIKFEIKRMINNKILFLLPILLIIIGFAGMAISFATGNQENLPEIKFLSIYSAYTQLTYLVLIYVFINSFASDFSNGVYPFMTFMGFSTAKCIRSKLYILTFTSVLIIDIFTVIASVTLRNTNYNLLILTLVSLDLSAIFIILFSLFLSLTIKKSLPATLFGYAMFVVFDIVNLFLYGLTNQADQNSISTSTLYAISGSGVIPNKNLMQLNLDFELNKYIYIFLPSLCWIVLLIIINTLILKRKSKHVI